MLDPESEEIREVYAFFGLAIYQAQCLEKQLAMVIATSGDSKPIANPVGLRRHSCREL